MSNGMRQRKPASTANGSEVAQDRKGRNGALKDVLKETTEPVTTSKADTKDPSIPLIYRSPIGRLWYESRRLSSGEKPSKNPFLQTDDKTLRSPGEDRPLTWKNSIIAFKVFHLSRSCLMQTYWIGKEGLILLCVMQKILSGTLPAVRLWARGQLMEMVDKSLRGNSVRLRDLVSAALVSFVSSIMLDLIGRLFNTNSVILRDGIINQAEAEFLAAQLALSIPTTQSTQVSALIYEAEVFTGMKMRMSGSIMAGTLSPSSVIFDVLELIGHFARLFSQLYLVYRTFFTVNGGYKGILTLAPILLALAPSMLRIFMNKFVKRRRGIRFPRNRSDNPSEVERAMRDVNEARNMVIGSGYKQEVILYGLQEWVLDRWKRAKEVQTSLARTQTLYDPEQKWDLVKELTSVGVEDAFQILVARSSLAINISLGCVQVYRGCATIIVESVNQLASIIYRLFQTIFFYAAFCQFTSDPEDLELRVRRNRSKYDPALINYEDIRQDGGVTIEARDLSFRYPGAKAPTLKGINLTIEAGETLACVGVNGGAKTTLVKVLTGLYDGEGELTINGIPMKDLDPSSFHKKTSCLFQDYSTYNFTLRENVGLGNTKLMDDDDKINEAITHGGATGVRDKVGLDGMLNRNGARGNVANRSGFARSLQTPPETDNEVEKDDTKQTAKVVMGAVWKRWIIQLVEVWRRVMGSFAYHLLPNHSVENNRKGDVAEGLSGGQWQRVALSRAFLRAEESDLIVFDEPSSSLDPEAEAELFQTIHSLSTKGGRKVTTIYISHRFSTVRQADKIAVVEDGSIVEIGSHEKLMALQGRYHKLFSISKRGYEDPVAHKPLANGVPHTPPSRFSMSGLSTPTTPATPLRSVMTPTGMEVNGDDLTS